MIEIRKRKQIKVCTPVQIRQKNTAIYSIINGNYSDEF